MFAYIKGKITHKTPTSVVLEAAGIGYGLLISLNTYSQLSDKSEAQLWIHNHIREDAFDLFGFYTQDERDMFRLLISVSGIGPNTARIVLSSMTSGETRAAILGEDELAFKKVKGVGPKTAKRLIIDLKDKVLKGGTDDLPPNVKALGNTQRQEALSALLALGFNRQQIQKSFAKISSNITDEMSTEDLIKHALKDLAKA